MITLLFAATVLAMLWWLVSRRPAAAVAGAFLLFSLVTRTIALIYLDLAGPVYSSELGEDVGGGPSMPLFALSVLAFMVPLAYAFRPAHLRTWVPEAATAPRARGLGNTLFIAIFLFLAALYLDMVFRGPVPLLSGIDRLDYNSTIAGPLHPLVLEHAFLFAGTIGCMFVYPRLHGREFDFRFLGLLVAFFVYYALTGNRFSAFYGFAGYFAIPLAALPAARSMRALAPAPRRRSPLKRFVCSRGAVVAAGAAFALALAGLLVNNIVNVRAYDDPGELFAQRTLVQPVQLWFNTWNTLGERLDDSFNPWSTAFVNPIDATRNTSIQVLMIKNLGDARAEELIEAGTQFAGGYPEILFELFGPWLALPIALAFGCVTVLLMRTVVASVYLGRFLTAFFALYVLFGFNLLYIGGMLNFLAVWTFGAKILALFAAYFLETRLHRRKRARRTPSRLPSVRTIA